MVIGYWLLVIKLHWIMQNWHEAMKKLQKLIGDLEIMVAAADPGIVITENISISCSITLLEAINELKKTLAAKRLQNT